MADSGTQGGQNLNMQGGATMNGMSNGISHDEGVILSPPPAPGAPPIQGHVHVVSEKSIPPDVVHGQLLNFDSGGAPLPMSPPQNSETSDSKNYEFDPLTPELTSPHIPDFMSDAKRECGPGGAVLIDLEDGVRNIHEVSTAEVTPQSPPAGSQDPFDALQQMTSPDNPNKLSMNPFEQGINQNQAASTYADQFQCSSNQNQSSTNPFLQSMSQTETTSHDASGLPPFENAPPNPMTSSIMTDSMFMDSDVKTNQSMLAETAGLPSPPPISDASEPESPVKEKIPGHGSPSRGAGLASTAVAMVATLPTENGRTADHVTEEQGRRSLQPEPEVVARQAGTVAASPPAAVVKDTATPVATVAPTKMTPPQSPRQKQTKNTVHEASPKGSPQRSPTKSLTKTPSSPARAAMQNGAKAKENVGVASPRPRTAEEKPTESTKEQPQPSPRSRPTEKPKTAPTRIPSPKKKGLSNRSACNPYIYNLINGASDSGIEDDKNVKKESKSTPQKTPQKTHAATEKKKSGIDAKNESHKPGGSNVKTTEKKVEVKHATSRVDAKATPSPKKADASPRSPRTPSTSAGVTKTAKSKIGSLKNTTYTPGGGNVKIESKKTDYSAVQSKCGSKDYIKHTPGGGDKRVESHKLEWTARSKIGSMDNARHRPGGGEKKIENRKLEWKVESRVGSMENAKHKAGGGDKKVQ